MQEPNPRIVRRWINRIAQFLSLLEPEREIGDFYRTSHLMVCRMCGEPYWRHASDPREPFLTMLCNGDRVKL